MLEKSPDTNHANIFFTPHRLQVIGLSGHYFPSRLLLEENHPSQNNTGNCNWAICLALDVINDKQITRKIYNWSKSTEMCFVHNLAYIYKIS